MRSESDAVVVVLAAGAGRRLGVNERPKAFIPIGGRPMLAIATAAAAASPAVGRIVVAAPAGWEESARECVELCGCPTTVVTGGPTRQASVQAALDAIGSDVAIVVIHDAARPFAAPDLFTRVIAAVGDELPGAIPVVPVTDTVKRLRDGRIAGTLDREELGLAQTPQAFVAPILRAAHERAAAAGLVLTDDASMLERAGFDVGVVSGDPLNTKITTLFDLAQAEARMGGVRG